MTSQEIEIFQNDCYNIQHLKHLALNKVYDFGGNIGNFVKFASMLNCPIESYEPFDPQFTELKKVCDSTKNATAIKKAITNNGRDVFKESWPFTEQDRISQIGIGTEKVASISINDFLDKEHCFFKVDIEGGEIEIFHQLKKIAEKNWISIELHGNKQPHEVFLNGLNYTTYGNRGDIFVARIIPSIL